MHNLFEYEKKNHLRLTVYIFWPGIAFKRKALLACGFLTSFINGEMVYQLSLSNVQAVTN